MDRFSDEDDDLRGGTKKRFVKGTLLPALAEMEAINTWNAITKMKTEQSKPFIDQALHKQSESEAADKNHETEPENKRNGGLDLAYAGQPEGRSPSGYESRN